MRALICISIVAGLWGQQEAVQNRDRVRASLKQLQEAARRKDDYLYERRMAKRELTVEGKVRVQSVTTMRRDPWEELAVMRVIAKDDKPLTAEESAKQEERLRRGVIEMRRTPRKPKFEEETWMDELPDALEFRHVGEEMRHGRPADMYTFEPRVGYRAKSLRAKAFANIKGKVWVDQAEGEMTKLDVEVVDAINVGFGLLGKLEKGTHFEMERKKWQSGVWFEEWQRVRYDLRMMMVKSLRQEIETWWTNLSLRPGAKVSQAGG